MTANHWGVLCFTTAAVVVVLVVVLCQLHHEANLDAEMAAEPQPMPTPPADVPPPLPPGPPIVCAGPPIPPPAMPDGVGRYTPVWMATEVDDGVRMGITVHRVADGMARTADGYIVKAADGAERGRVMPAAMALVVYSARFCQTCWPGAARDWQSPLPQRRERRDDPHT